MLKYLKYDTYHVLEWSINDTVIGFDAYSNSIIRPNNKFPFLRDLGIYYETQDERKLLIILVTGLTL
jgi:hypothetical protein